MEQLDGVLVDRPGKWMPRWQTWPLWDNKAIAMHSRRLRSAVNIKPGDDFVAFLFHPCFWPYIQSLKPRTVAFHVYDVYSQMDNWSDLDQQFLEQVVESADLLTAATMGMARALPGNALDRVRILPNGVNLSLFDLTMNPVIPCPTDLAEIPHPRIGNTGTLNRKMDFQLIADIAAQRPEWHWVMVGLLPEEELLADEVACKGLAACRQRANIHFLGPKQQKEVPAYTYHMDVNTICYRIREGEWVGAGYPVKLNEYLAVGKPVVAAAQEAVVQYFSDVVAIASGTEEWVAALEHAVMSGGVSTVEQRRAKAEENTWDRRVDQLEMWLKQALEKGE
ncbi:MAG: glycosyltransferase [Candidatus Polarisedimenticolaceae bacterium]|nr:glycosyltransferase [Candidatus Polarisedimenticolaceae bacterium]